MTKTDKRSEKNLFWKIILRQTVYFIRETPISWLFGLFLSLPTIAVIILESFFSQFQETDPLLIAPKIMGIFLFAFFLFFISESGLILSFKKNTYSPIEHIAATGALLRWYFLFLLILLAFFAIFFSPLIAAPEEARSILKYICLIFFLLIACIAFIMKMFGEFYLILSRLSLRNALRSSANLFTNHSSLSAATLIITSLLSVFVSLALTTLHAYLRFPLSEGLLLNTLIISFVLALSSCFHIFFRAFWYFFFQAIAGEKPNSWQKEKKMVEESMVPAEDEA